MIDTLNVAHYPLLAGLHCQSVVADRFIGLHQNLSLLRDSFEGTSRLFPVAVGRERDTFGCAGVNPIQSANPFSFCHHNSLMLWQNSQYKGVGYAYSFYNT